MSWWVEISEHPRHGKPPILLPLSEIDEYWGFRSIYAYPYELASLVDQNGSVVGIKNTNYPLYSDRLFVDIDNDPEGAEAMIATLSEWGVGFEVWDSGGRSVHLHIDIVPMEGVYVPESQLKWIEGIEAASGAVCDHSIYHPVGLYRLAGTKHQRTGRVKSLVKKYKGVKVEIEVLKEAPSRSMVGADRYEQLTSLYRLCMKSITTGGRRFHVWKIASHCAALGMSREEAMDHAKWWNSNCREPLTQSQMLQKVGACYRD